MIMQWITVKQMEVLWKGTALNMHNGNSMRTVIVFDHSIVVKSYNEQAGMRTLNTFVCSRTIQ